MGLVGELASVDLAQVFQVLTQNQKDGVLQIFRGGQSRALRFRRGAVTLQFDRDDYEERAIEIFRKLGQISEEKLHLAAANREASDSALLDVLVEMAILSPGDVLTIFRERMAEELYDFFTWNEGTFEFHEGAEALASLGGEVDQRLYFPADGIVMEAACRVDELSRIRDLIKDDLEIFAPAVAELAPEDELQSAVFSEIDGSRPIRSIAQKLGKGTFEIQKTFWRLYQLGAIAPVPPEEFPERGRCTREAGRPREAAFLFDLAAEAQVGVPAVLREAAECWEEVGEPAHAAERFVKYGDSLINADDRENAAAAYCRAHDLIPTNIEAWKKAVLITLQLESEGVESRSAPAPQALAEICREIGQSEITIEVLDRLVQVRPHDVAAKRALVPALDFTGDRARQCALLESIANDLIKLNDVSAAASTLQMALRFQPDRRDLSNKIRELYRRDEQKRTRARYVSLVIMILAIGAALLFYLYTRNEAARTKLASLDIDGILRVGDFARARKTIDDFRNEFKFTLVENDALQLVDRVDAAEHDFKEQERAKYDREREARGLRLNQARELAKAANDKVNKSDLQGALTDLRRALSVAPHDWDMAPTARTNAADLDRYLSEGAELGKRLDGAIQSNDLPSAREIVKKLIASYPQSPAGQGARFPVVVETDPPGAQLELDGEMYKNSGGETMRTPLVIFVAQSKRASKLNATLAGFSPASAEFDAASDANLHLHLGRAAELAVALPAAPTAPPAVVGNIVYIPLAGSRIAAFENNETPAWIVSIASSGEVISAPRPEKDGLIVATSDGVIAKLSYDDGHALWHRRLNSGIRVSPITSGAGVLAATDDGRVRLLDRSTGEIRREWRSHARPTGAIAISEPALAVGLPDGKIQIIDTSAARPDEKIINFSAQVSAIVMMDDVLVASGDDGRVTGFEWSTGRLLWESPGGRIAAPRPVIRGEHVFVDRGGRLSVLDLHTGSATAQAPDPYELDGAIALQGPCVVAPLRDGSVVSFNANDLTVVWHWPGAVGGALGQSATASRPAAKRLEVAAISASESLAAAVANGKLFRFSVLQQNGASSRDAGSADPMIR
ncbi:MAG: PQQ-binding-like beta-propeller repeat protein [Planctomycetes bacterium]|nr:PQQ-binding-like beta-propeller repeat protein [Planctomycetota bacterium]